MDVVPVEAKVLAPPKVRDVDITEEEDLKTPSPPQARNAQDRFAKIQATGLDVPSAQTNSCGTRRNVFGDQACDREDCAESKPGNRSSPGYVAKLRLRGSWISEDAARRECQDMLHSVSAPKEPLKESPKESHKAKVQNLRDTVTSSRSYESLADDSFVTTESETTASALSLSSEDAPHDQSSARDQTPGSGGSFRPRARSCELPSPDQISITVARSPEGHFYGPRVRSISSEQPGGQMMRAGAWKSTSMPVSPATSATGWARRSPTPSSAPANRPATPLIKGAASFGTAPRGQLWRKAPCDVSSYSGLYTSFTAKGFAGWRSPSPASPAVRLGRTMTRSVSAGAAPPPSPAQRWEKHAKSQKPPSASVDDVEQCNRKPAAAVVALVQQLTRSQLESLVIAQIDDGSMLMEDVSRLLNLGEHPPM